MPPTARVGDKSVCPLHGAGIIQPPGALTVSANSMPTARVTDRLLCAGGIVDFIVTGSSGVEIAGLPAARVGDKTLHGGTITTGSGDVNAGGVTVGGMLGFPAAWRQTFDAEATGRASGKPQQTYGNCAVESSRALVLANGGTVAEPAALDWAIANGLADADANPSARGGTSPDGRQTILAHDGVASHQEDATSANLSQAVAEGRGVITSHDAGKLWGDNTVGGHAITVIGLQYGANRQISDVITNDTGLGVGERSVPATQFFDSLRPGRPMNVSNSPLKR